MFLLWAGRMGPGRMTFVGSPIGGQVVYLAPAPHAPFVALTHALADRFPECEPYGAADEDVIPHLTVADGGALGDLRTAAASLVDSLPLTAEADEVWLMTGGHEPGSWKVVRAFPLATVCGGLANPEGQDR